MDRYLKMVYLTEAGEGRDANAELELAAKSWRGLGRTLDQDAARQSLDRIHRKGRGLSAYCYAFMHAEGIGVDKDPAAAEGFFLKAT